MNLGEKVTVQIISSLMIFSAIKTAGMISWEPVREMRAWISEQFSIHYTTDDVKKAGTEFLKKAGNAGEMLVSAVISANQPEQNINILGEPDGQGIQVVYAPSGGDVLTAGINEEHGMYVCIKQEDKIFIFGNMSDISVLTGERVRKGDIIGSYDSACESEFVYELTDIDFSQEI